MEVQVLPGLRPRLNRLVQHGIASTVPADMRAEQFAMELLNDLVAPKNARSSVWDAQVELLEDIVQSGTRHKSDDRFNAVTRHLADARTRARAPRPLPGTLFVPMS